MIGSSLVRRAVGGPVGFRRLLERLGPTFIKFGQFLALRPDIIPQEYADELMSLLDRVEPFPWADARSILQQELGDLTQFFSSIDPEPLAAGSLAQVHAATTMDGSRVAIKILRPEIRERVLKDLRRVRLLARLLAWSHVEFVASTSEVVEELRTWLMQELDLTRELDNLRRLGELTKLSPTERVPRAYPRLSTARVLTTELLHGIPISEVLAYAREDPSRLQLLNLDADQLAANILQSTLRQIFEYRFFHADVHPGNLIALPGNVIGYVDFGLCASLDENVRAKQAQYLESVYNLDTERMFHALMELLVATPDADPEGLRRDFSAESSLWLGQAQDAGRGAGSSERRSPISHWLIGVLRAVSRNRFRVPTSLLAIYRTLLTSETIAYRLGSPVSLRQLGRSFFVSLQIRDAVGTLQAGNLKSVAISVLTLLRDAPGQLDQIASELSEGTFVVQTNVRMHPSLARTRDQRVRLVVTAIACVGIAFLLGEPTLAPSASPVFGRTLGLLLAFLYVYIFIQWRRLR